MNVRFSRRTRLAGSPAEAGPGRVPEEDHPTFRQPTRHADQVPFLIVFLVEQRLQLLLWVARGHPYILGVVPTSRLAFSLPGWISDHGPHLLLVDLL